MTTASAPIFPPATWRALAVLRETLTPDIPAAIHFPSLARELGMEPSTLRYALHPLRAVGVLQVEAVRAGRRVVTLTAAGWALTPPSKSASTSKPKPKPPQYEAGPLSSAEQRTLAVLRRLLADGPQALRIAQLNQYPGVPAQPTLSTALQRLVEAKLVDRERSSRHQPYIYRLLPAGAEVVLPDDVVAQAAAAPAAPAARTPEALPAPPDLSYEQAAALLSQVEEEERQLLMRTSKTATDLARLHAIVAEKAQLNDVRRRARAARNGVARLGAASMIEDRSPGRMPLNTGGRRS